MARTPAPKHTRTCRVHKVWTLPDHTGARRLLHFTVHDISRRTRFAEVGHVPEFDGDVAWFLMEQRNKARLGYVFVRQVEEPPPTKYWHRLANGDFSQWLNPSASRVAQPVFSSDGAVSGK